jgi:DNA polymerase III subunit epsilon
MREIILDTETTGMSPEEGDRLVEIGCIELKDLIPTGRKFHAYINPERDVPEGAFKVHGLSTAFLADKPVFTDPSVVDGLLAFIGEDRIVAHNAEFDRKFITAELRRAGKPVIGAERWVDTLAIARKRYPGAPNSLDALCRRFEISLETREKHGALIDSLLLAEVYLQLHGGRERRLALGDAGSEDGRGEAAAYARIAPRPQPLVSRATAEELAAHEAFIATLGKGKPLWALYSES